MPKKQQTKSASRRNKVFVSKEMNLGEVATLYPVAAEVMLEYGLHCIGCFANAYDTVEVGAKVHGMTDQEVDEMLQRVNEAIAKAGALA